MSQKPCTICKIEKDIEKDFYCYRNGTKRAACKKCHDMTAKIELRTCPVCQIVIRKVGMKRHERIKRHENAKFCNVSYDYNRLPQHMRRRESVPILMI
jgi:hypothetical protein